MKKIIVITRDVAYTNQSPAPPSSLWAYVEKCRYKTTHFFEFYLSVILQQIDKISKPIERAKALKEFNSLINNKGNDAVITAYHLRDEDSLNKFVENNVNIYIEKNANEIRTIYKAYQSESAEVIFVFWNNIIPNNYFTKRTFADNRNRLKLIKAICDDCDVDKSGNNRLYIHDEEWGKGRQDAILINNDYRDKNLITQSEFQELGLTFDFMATFRHIGVAKNVTIFDNIKNFNFDVNDTLTTQLEILDEMREEHDFLYILDKLDELIKIEL